MSSITVFRLDHRIFRDQRITSHAALTSRALGAQGFIYSGEKDDNMEESVVDVVDRWGGSFEIKYSESIKSQIQNWKGISVHLTMYGESHHETLKTIKNLEEDILLIVGGPKVSPYVYSISDFNTAIGWQPHSEVAAVAIFLSECQLKNKLYFNYDDAKMQITKGSYKSRRSKRFQ